MATVFLFVSLLTFCPILGHMMGMMGMMMMGGWNEKSVKDKAVQEMADFALTTINSRSNSMYLSKMVDITSAKTQLVSGMNYNLTIRIGATSCRKGVDEDKDLDKECNLNNGGVEECNVTVYDQSWTNTRTLTYFNCARLRDSVENEPAQNVRRRDIESSNAQSMPGGKLQIDENSQESQDALAFAIEELNKRHDQSKRAMISDVMSVHSQVVAGVKYTIKFHLAESLCDNTEENHGATISQCPIASKPEIEECEVDVLHQAWSTPSYQLLDPISCKQKANPIYYKNKFMANKNLKNKHVDATMNQAANEVVKPMFGGGDDHDYANWGVFEQYMTEFNKVYADRNEMKERFKIFRKNMKIAREYTEKEEGTAVYGPNEFSDMSEEEFARYYRNPEWDTSYDPSLKQAEIPEDPAPASFDWRDHNAVTEVKNQGMCGSCWAFSTTGNIEGQWAIAKGKLISLSEQELVDCDKLDDGCDGGLPTNAYKEIRRIGGLETEKDYPYEGEDEKCAFKPSESRVYINGSLNITKDETEMAQWLAKNGPISIGINANMMQFYFGGVSHPWKFFCSPDTLDHGVLIVGYGTKKGYFSDTPYWIVKNSWGESWGEKGYYLVYRGDGTCGLNQMCTSAEIN